jgi:cytidine deaminase
MSDSELIEEAKKARDRAYAPYSRLKVGAALLASDGRTYSGCNIENASYSLTVCAERVALLKAASEGVRKITRVAVVSDTGELTPPCGCCRQMIHEFGDDETEVILANLDGKTEVFRIRDLLPRPFDSSHLPDWP